MFVFENVYGLPGANGGGPWREITSAFEALGYRLHHEVVDAADYGVPQHRERLIMVGARKGRYAFPLPTHGPDAGGADPLVSVERAISDLQDPEEPSHNSLGGLYGHLLPEVPEGLNYAYFTAEMGHPQPAFAWRSKFHDLLYKADRKEPCRTIKAQPGKFTGPFHWKNRHFTQAELKRLQTFPDSYQIVGSYGKVLEQIGNSVPPRLAFVLATSVREQLLEARAAQTFAVRPRGFASTFRSRKRQKSRRFRQIAAAAIRQRYGEGVLLPLFSAGGQGQGSAGAGQQRYFVRYKGLFDRKVGARRGRAAASVAVEEAGPRIRMDFTTGQKACQKARAQVQIAGLRKYLPEYDTLVLQGVLGGHQDIFHMWQEVEEALVRRSKFFSLIDIYGHYANRGDVVDIAAKFQFSAPGPLQEAVRFFSQTENCGKFLECRDVWGELGVPQDQVEDVVGQMRDIRFDLRTPATHPIIGQGKLLCTYPFPLLSPRALVESRAVLRDAA